MALRMRSREDCMPIIWLCMTYVAAGEDPRELGPRGEKKGNVQDTGLRGERDAWGEVKVVVQT